LTPAALAALNEKLRARIGAALDHVVTTHEGPREGTRIVEGVLAGERAMTIAIDLDERGEIDAIHAPVGNAAGTREASEAFEKMLRDTHGVAASGAPLAPGQTHVADPAGGPPIRKRFSAF
jgi:hypothetical protein